MALVGHTLSPKQHEHRALARRARRTHYGRTPPTLISNRQPLSSLYIGIGMGMGKWLRHSLTILYDTRLKPHITPPLQRILSRAWRSVCLLLFYST